MPLHFNLISMKSYEKKRELITYVLLFIHLFFDQSQWTLSYENRIEDKFKIGNSFSQADNNLDEFDLIELERVSNSRVLITPSLKVIISTRAGADENTDTSNRLKNSVISKALEQPIESSVNKLLKQLIERTSSIATSNAEIVKLLLELAEEMPEPPITKASAMVLPTRRYYKNTVNKYSSPASKSLMRDYDHRFNTKCRAARQQSANSPRLIYESFGNNKSLKKLYRNAMKNPKLKKEYSGVKKELGSGIDAQDIGKKSCRVSATKVLIKKRIGRYLVDDSKKEIEVLAVAVRGDDNEMEKFEKLLNKLYNLNIRGY